MKDKLVELILESEILCNTCGENAPSYCAEAIADLLLANCEKVFGLPFEELKQNLIDVHKSIQTKDVEIESLQRQLHNVKLFLKENLKALRNERLYRDHDRKMVKSEAIKEFAESVINDILPEFMKGHEEMALKISFEISQKAKEIGCL